MVKKQVILCMVLLLIVLSSCRSTEKLVTPTSENDLASPAAIISTSTTPSPAKFPSGWVTFTNGNEQIYDIALDQNGYLWAASQGGLVKWNTSNNTYKKFTTADGLPANRIDSVFVTNDGIVWVGASGSISSFDGNKWETHKDLEKQGFISQIFQDSNGKLWFVGEGATTFDGKTWKTYTIENGLGSNAVASITEDKQGNIWLGTWFFSCGCEGSPKYTEGVSRFNGQTWDVLGKDIGLDDNDPMSGIQVNAISVDDKGGIWFGTSEFGAMYYYDNKTRFFSVADGLSDNKINDIQIDTNGVVWFATENGVSTYDGQFWKIFTTQDGLSDNLVLSVSIAPDNNIWFGTASGISLFAKNKWETYFTDDGLPLTYVNRVSSVSNGSVWLATNRGATYFDGNKWITLTEENGLPNNTITIVSIAPDNSLWFGTSDSVAYLNQDKWTTYSSGYIPNEGVYDIAFDSLNGVWIGSYDSYYFDGNKWSEYIEGVRSEKVIYSKKSGYWRGSWGGVSRFDNHEWTDYGPQGTNDVGWDTRALAVSPNGDVWVASDLSDDTFHTETGFKFFDGKNWVLAITLDNSHITDMDFSPDGALWVATREGAYKYDGKNWIHYTRKDGLAGDEITDIHVAGDGAIWFATLDGLTRLGK